MRGQEADALMQQPAGKQETTTAVAKVMAMAMAMGYAAPPSRDLAATVLVLPAEAAAALIGDDADGGNSQRCQQRWCDGQ
jgi:hypothetical protein